MAKITKADALADCAWIMFWPLDGDLMVQSLEGTVHGRFTYSHEARFMDSLLFM
jgi:hypothetical protein